MTVAEALRLLRNQGELKAQRMREVAGLIERLSAEVKSAAVTNGELTDALVEIRDNPKCDAPKRAEEALGPTPEGIECECGAVNYPRADRKKPYCGECGADLVSTRQCEHGKGLTDYCEPCGRVNGGV